ncbi:MAG: dTDP-4-dehydrorhamnose reductase [Anaerolineae bacterium]|nr:dTDP-4-dehydrorhamnose reductase [Anaerolineae bacterium]
MRILITGAAGRLGSLLATSLHSAHDIITADYDEFDITDFQATRAFITQAAPELIIHAAAWTDVDGCAREPDKAVLINGYGTQHVALSAAALGAAMVYVSSNEVFDGKAAKSYREYDPTAPANPYGYSKWVGEQVVARHVPRHYIVRTAWLFAHGGKNFIQAILNAAGAGKTIRVVVDEVANPTYTNDLADALTALIATERYGTYHFVNEGVTSRYAFARYILDRAGYADTPIARIASAEWQRASTPPPYSPLENSAGRALGITLRPWHAAVDAFLDKEGLITQG